MRRANTDSNCWPPWQIEPLAGSIQTAAIRHEIGIRELDAGEVGDASGGIDKKALDRQRDAGEHRDVVVVEGQIWRCGGDRCTPIDEGRQIVEFVV